MRQLDTLAERVHRPEYTGENRCWPCTALNLAILAVLGGVLFVVDRLLALAVVVVGTLLVSLRGYLLPGTPWIAPRVVDSLPVDVGHGTPDAGGSLGDSARERADGDGSGDAGTDHTPEQLLAALVDAGVLVADGEDLSLAESFCDAWVDRMAALRALSNEALSVRAADAAAGEVEGQAHNDRILIAGERDVWLRPAVAVAETAAAETLADWGVDPSLGGPAAHPLRMFLPSCPACGGDVHETTIQNCCGGPGSIQGNPEQPVLACEDCETVLFEFDE
jgi:hypothetical protein